MSTNEIITPEQPKIVAEAIAARQEIDASIAQIDRGTRRAAGLLVLKNLNPAPRALSDLDRGTNSPFSDDMLTAMPEEQLAHFVDRTQKGLYAHLDSAYDTPLPWAQAEELERAATVASAKGFNTVADIALSRALGLHKRMGTEKKGGSEDGTRYRGVSEIDVLSTQPSAEAQVKFNILSGNGAAQ